MAAGVLLHESVLYDLTAQALEPPERLSVSPKLPPLHLTIVDYPPVQNPSSQDN